MRFYNQPHRFYCGVDLHARTMYLCILDANSPRPGPAGHWGRDLCDRSPRRCPLAEPPPNWEPPRRKARLFAWPAERNG